ncbi:MAG: hypothetical protein QM617_04835 [Comamonas sp.]
MTKNLFQSPVSKTIAGQTFLVSKVPFEAFDAAVTFGQWLLNHAGGVMDLAALEQLKGDSAVKQALQQLLAACLAVDVDGAPQPLTAADVQRMPIPMVLEAAYVVLETNLDFFTQSLAAIRPIQDRLMSIGSPLLSNSSPPATTASRSGAIATAS